MLDFITGYLILLFILSVHECAHAWMADRCGDPTARLVGRMTLDPRAHIDPLGTIIIPLLPLLFGLLHGVGMGLVGGFRFFGWAKPVPVNPLNVRHWRRDNMLISFAGCGSGFLLAFCAALFIRGFIAFFPPHFPFAAAAVNLLWRLGSIAVWLSLFNLIPVPPLDGYGILSHALRFDLSRNAAALQSMGPWLLLFLINTPIIYSILNPITAVLLNIFLAIAGL